MPRPTSKQGWFRALLGLALGWALRLLRMTWRVRVVGAPPTGPGLLSFWHGDLLCLCALRHSEPPAVLISRSRDGDLASRAALVLGLPVLRGSSSSGGVAGAMRVCRLLRQGRSAALAVDGPRGPRHQVNSAASRLAGLGGVEVIPVAGAARRGWTIRTWDRLSLPAPFTRVEVRWGSPLASSASPGDLKSALDQLRARAGEAMRP